MGFMVQTTVGSCETSKHSNAISGVIFVDHHRPSLTPPVLHHALNSPVDWTRDLLARGYIGPSMDIPTVTGVMRVGESVIKRDFGEDRTNAVEISLQQRAHRDLSGHSRWTEDVRPERQQL